MAMQFRVTSISGSSSDSNGQYGTGHPKAFAEVEIREKIRNLEQLKTNIAAAKEAFLENFNNAHKNIEIIIKNLSGSVRVREKELKDQLELVGNEKIVEWDRQIKLCQQGMENLKNMDENFLRKVEDIQMTFNNFAQKIGFIDAGKIVFSANSVDVVKELKNLGTVSLKDVEKPPEKIHPKFVIERQDRISQKFWQPRGVCVDATGRILVADFRNDMIQIFNEYGRFLFQFGQSGSGPGEFNRPSGISADKKCRIAVSDKDNHRVQIFSFTGKFLITFGQKGTGPGEFQYPSGIAVNQNCDIAVCDNRNHRIQLFNSDGRFITHFDFNKSISDPNPRVCPRGLAFQPDGSVLVTDSRSHYILLIDKNFSVVTKIGEKHFSLKAPQGIACSCQGVFAVTDGKNRIQMFDKYGDLLKTLDVGEADPESVSCFHGICFRSNGGFVVADIGDPKILVF